MSLEVELSGPGIDVTSGGQGPKGPPGHAGPRGPVGDPGPQGDKGDTGADGPIGPRGLQGVPGPQGVKGNQGSVGPSGPLGSTGPQGPRGQQGVTGNVGPVGPLGPQGATGAKGATGATGAKGDKGDPGLTGSTGPQGVQGVVGPAGPKGDVGQKGNTGSTGPIGPAGGVGPQGPQGGQGNPGSPGIPGAPGARGPQGADGTGLEIKGTATWTVISAIGVPATGDTWILSANDATAPSPPSGGGGGSVGDGIFYTGTAWTNIGPIRGPAGPTGPQGIQGAIGATGAKGDKGDKGDTGNTGSTGPQGSQGSQGVQGITGAKGDKGDRGLTGPQGVQGFKGDKGDTGAIGPVGNQGPVGPQGSQGTQGIEGPQGIQGATGPQGIKGDTGAAGATGTAGTPGAKGDLGPGVTVRGTSTWSVIKVLPTPVSGDLWILSAPDPTAPSRPGTTSGGAAGDGLAWTGAAPWVNAGPIRGPQGDVGPTGPQGATGPSGPSGPQGVKGDTGVQGAASTVPGPQGATGQQGTGVRFKGTVPTGSSPPLPTSGNVIGDVYVADDTGNGWQWSFPGSWVEIGRIRGNAGPKGDKGDTGLPGADGQDGANSNVAGPQGPPGPDNYPVLDLRYITSATGGSIGMAAGGAGVLTIRSNDAAIRCLRNSATDGGAPFIGFYDKTNATRYGYLQMQAANCVIRTEGATNPPIVLQTGSTTRLTIDDTVITSAVAMVTKALTCDALSCGAITSASITAIGRIQAATTGGSAFQLVDIDTTTSGTPAIRHPTTYVAFYGLGSVSGTTVTTGTLSGYVGYNGGDTLWMNNSVTNGQIILRTAGTGAVYIQPGATTAATFTGNDCAIAGTMTAASATVTGALSAVSATVSGAQGTGGNALTRKDYVDGKFLISSGDTMTGGFTVDLPTATVIYPIAFKASGVLQGTISATTATKHLQFNDASDYRIKENVIPLTGALDRICATRPVEYDFIDTKGHTRGFIAHELAEVFPEAVIGVKDGPDIQTVATARLIPDLVAAVKELRAEVAALRSAA